MPDGDSRNGQPRAGLRRTATASLAVVTPLGWTVLLLGMGCWAIGWRLGWDEAMAIAAAAGLLLALCALLTAGRVRLAVGMSATPQRVVVGAPATGVVRVRNLARRRMLPVGLELPMGPGGAMFMLPTLAAGAEYDAPFVVPTDRRGVVAIGPAATMRGDPLGLLRRSTAWTERVDVFVHPITVHLDALGTGRLRDLEGQTVNELSPSDLAFHALREYEPGDARRHIHWRSSAKVGTLMVRQFLDTRRTHVAVILDADEASYSRPDDFELAICIAASLTLRVARDQQDVTVLAGSHLASSNAGRALLDAFSRVQLDDRPASGRRGLAGMTHEAIRIVPDLSMVLLVTGGALPYVEVQRAAGELPPEVRVVAVRADQGQQTGFQEAGGTHVLTLSRLGDLPGALRGMAE